jgi:hypothetical protein
VSFARHAFAAIAVVLALSPACNQFEPEVGDLLAPCVDADSDPNTTVSFKDQIRPIINGDVAGPRPCANCHYHSRGTQQGLAATGFDLETLGLLRKGGVNTADDILVPGKPCSSAIVEKIRGTYHIGVRMPKDGPYWSPAQAQLMIDWVFEGAKGADDE